MKNLKEYSLCIENVCQRVGERKLTSKPSFVDFLRIYFNGVDYCTSASETKCFQISDKEGGYVQVVHRIVEKSQKHPP